MPEWPIVDVTGKPDQPPGAAELGAWTAGHAGLLVNGLALAWSCSRPPGEVIKDCARCVCRCGLAPSERGPGCVPTMEHYHLTGSLCPDHLAEAEAAAEYLAAEKELRVLAAAYLTGTMPRYEPAAGTARGRGLLVLLAAVLKQRPDAAWPVLRNLVLAMAQIAYQHPPSAAEVDAWYAHRVADALDPGLGPALSVTPAQVEAALAAVTGFDPAPDPRTVWEALRRTVYEDATAKGALR